MKKSLLAVALLATTLFLSGCDAPCTEQVIKDKLEEVSEKIQKIAASGDMSKLMAIGTFSQKLNNLQDADRDNLEPVCEAVDELLAELDAL
ncbi:MAG: hypothetical protein DWP95_12550 [Proteobacteria bacterium]|nr:MAG: hypothetical protein DWP95_12550 [Pseudomonadota bacterium]